MGFWKALFGRPADHIPPEQDQTPAATGSPGDTLPPGLHGDGSFGLPLVGESQYQENLAAAAGGRRAEGCDVVVTATLVLEDSNPYDPRAVRVDVVGKTIGYLTRDKARKYRDRLAASGQSRRAASCRARIICGAQEPGGGRRLFGAWLDLDLRKSRH